MFLPLRVGNQKLRSFDGHDWHNAHVTFCEGWLSVQQLEMLRPISGHSCTHVSAGYLILVAIKAHIQGEHVTLHVSELQRMFYCSD
jgi:hypothetical protein